MFTDDIRGHAHAKERLASILSSGRVPQALLIVGPTQVGKSLLALRTAQALQCPRGGCADCATCRAVAAGSHLDTLVLADDGESVTIEMVRALSTRLSLTGQSSAKVVIVEAVGRMTHEAQGALLKTLEEPTARTHFLLTAESLEDVLPTIRSRTTVLPVSLVRETELRPLLPPGIDPQAQEDALLLADGRPGRILRELSLAADLRTRTDQLHDAELLLAAPDLLTRFRLLAQLTDDWEQPHAYLQLLFLLLRRALRAGGATGARARRGIRLALQAAASLRTNARPRLILEDLVVHLPVLDRIATRSVAS